VTKRGLTKDITRLVLAHMGPKQGKKESTALLLTSEELPGSSWKRSSVQTLRTGVIGQGDEITNRAKEQGAISSWGFYEDKQSSRSVLIKVGPLASVADAVERVYDFEARMLKRLKVIPGASNVVVQKLTLDSIPRQLVGIEYKMTTGAARNRNFKDLCLNEDEFIFSLTCSGAKEVWTWDEVVELARLQKVKISQYRTRDS